MPTLQERMWNERIMQRSCVSLESSQIKPFFFFLLWRCDPTRVMASSFLMFLDHTQRRATVGRAPLNEWSARRRDLYLTTDNNHNRQTSMPPVGFEPTISAGERSQTYALDGAATGTGKSKHFMKSKFRQCEVLHLYRSRNDVWPYWRRTSHACYQFSEKQIILTFKNRASYI